MPSCRCVVHLSCLSLALGFVTPRVSGAPDTNAPLSPPGDLPKQAAAYERQGDKARAAQAYEAIVAQEPGKGLVLAPRLVKLYAETGATNKALEWAHVVMKTNPDPQAYLAGVYGLLGDTREAKAILKKEIAAVPQPRRKLTLHWQLADVLETEGDSAAAEKELATAADLVKGTPDEAAARARMDRFKQKHQPPAK